MILRQSVNKDENFQKRQFLLSSFVRQKITLNRHVYEFCDFAIKNGNVYPTSGLNEVDIQVKKEYDEYLNNHG